MKQLLQKKRWSPYWVVTGIGILSWITFALMDKALGVSTTMVRVAGAAASLGSPAYTQANPYFVKYLGTAGEPKPLVEWQFALVLMLGIGAFVSAKMSRTGKNEEVPELWRWRFGGSKVFRYFGAFLSGMIIIFGARLAGGCTSGHGISGGLQLALSSWIFFPSLFIAGIITAFLIYSKKGGDHV